VLRARQTKSDQLAYAAVVTDVVNIPQAKTQLSRLIARVEAGEEITLARGGRPVARLVPLSVRTQPRKLGLLRGQVWIAPDFDAPEVNEDIARDFEA
jgi:prevent-host-death family protein